MPAVIGAEALKTQAFLGESGIVLNDTDAEGVQWRWAGESPWSPSPAPREQTGDRQAGHGQWDATQWYGPRTHAMAGTAQGNHVALHQAKERLKAAVSIRPFTLRITEPGLDRQAVVRRGGEVLWTETDPENAEWSIALYQADPFAYATDPFETFTGLPVSTGGVALPVALPHNIPGVALSGQLRMWNAGTEDAFPTYRVYGPLPDFTLAHPETGKTLTVDLAKMGSALVEGEWLEVNTKRQRVLLGGLSSRRSAFRGEFFGIPTGESDVLFTSSVHNPIAWVAVEMFHTWI